MAKLIPKKRPATAPAQSARESKKVDGTKQPDLPPELLSRILTHCISRAPINILTPNVRTTYDTLFLVSPFFAKEWNLLKYSTSTFWVDLRTAGEKPNAMSAARGSPPAWKVWLDGLGDGRAKLLRRIYITTYHLRARLDVLPVKGTRTAVSCVVRTDGCKYSPGRDDENAENHPTTFRKLFLWKRRLGVHDFKHMVDSVCGLHVCCCMARQAGFDGNAGNEKLGQHWKACHDCRNLLGATPEGCFARREEDEED